MKCEHFETEPISGRDIYYYYPNGDEAGFLCPKCATEAGFCPMCGDFVAGTESEIESMHYYGMCTDCAEELDELLSDN